MKNNRFPRLKATIIGGTFAWTAVIVFSLIWNILYTRQQTMAKADVMAQLALEKDVAFRSWVTSHGGVYVPVTEETPSNPYLDVPDKDGILRSGTRVTLMNPAYVMRQYYERSENNGGVKGHITSLKPLRPANTPDPWEEQSLLSFEKGEKQATIIQSLKGREYVRLMKPLLAATGCLKCHAAQGYQEGDIRGGISVSVPMTPLQSFERGQVAVIAGYHALFWVLGIAVILFFGKYLVRSENEREQAEQELRISEEKLAKVFQASPDWLSITTLEDGRYIEVNDAFVFMTGYRRDEAIGKNAEELGLWMDPEVYSTALKSLREYETLHNFEVNLRMKSGKIYTMLWSAEKIELKGQTYLVNAFKDITARKEKEEEINRIAYHDQLTGLPNRMLLLDRLNLAINHADRYRMKVALMMLDLDKFKEVNDTLGHQIGDKLLQAVAKKLTEILRKVDTVARFGGDEFVLLLPEQKDEEAVLRVAGKIIKAFRSPFVLEGHSLIITFSIGIALYPDHGTKIDTILKGADGAMYQAKQAGRNQFHLCGRT